MYEIWEASKHALATANIIDADSYKDDCLSCHATGYQMGGYDAAGEDLTKFAGVQCEACHGPGSDYKKMNIMKDRELAIENGLIIPARETCTQCHNTSFHEDLTFDYEEMWPIIEHHIPE